MGNIASEDLNEMEDVIDKNSPRRRRTPSESPRSAGKATGLSMVKASPTRLTRSQTKHSPHNRFVMLPMEKHSIKSRRNLFANEVSGEVNKRSAKSYSNSSNQQQLTVKSPRKGNSLPKKRASTQSTPTKRSFSRLKIEDEELESSAKKSPAKRRTPRKSKNDSDKVREMERNTQARGLRGRPSKSPTKSPNTMSSLPKHRNLLQKPKGVVETPKKDSRKLSKSLPTSPSRLNSLRMSKGGISPRKRELTPSKSQSSSSTKGFINFSGNQISEDYSQRPRNQENLTPNKNRTYPRKRGRPASTTPSNSPRKASSTRIPFSEQQNLRDWSDDESPRKLRRSSRLSNYSSSQENHASWSGSPRKTYFNDSESSFGDESLLSFEHDDSLNNSFMEHLNELKLENHDGQLEHDVYKEVDETKLSKFTNWTPPNQNEAYNQFLYSVHHQMFHMEHVERALNQGLDKVLRGDEGILLTVYGRSGSGKRTIINRVFRGRNEFEFVELDGRFASLLEVKAQLKDVHDLLKGQKPLVFVMYNFDALRPSFANKVLYSLTNHLRNYPFFLLLVTEKEGAVDALEKRIVSRVGQNSVKCTEHPLSVKECWELVHKLVKLGVEPCARSIKKAFKLPTEPPKHFHQLCYLLPNYAKLKSFVKKLVDEIFEWIAENKTIDIYYICAELLRPIDDLTLRLRGITDRMHGLMIAAALVTKDVTEWIPMVKIIREYKRFLNFKHIKLKRLCVENEQDLLEDIEYLVFQHFWVAKRQADKIVAVSWMEDPINLTRKQYKSIFMTELDHWITSELKDDTKLY